MEIISIDINPSTQGEITYRLGKYLNVFINGTEKDSPVVSAIDVYASPESKTTIVDIYVDGELYCRYNNVPYCAFYKTKHHK